MASLNEIIRAVVSYSISNGSVAQNVFWYQLLTAADTDSNVFDAIETWVEGDWEAAIDALQNVLTLGLLLEVDVINVDGTVLRNIGSGLVTLLGSGATDSSPPACSAFMQAETENATSKGRKYIPGLDEGIHTTGELTAAGLTALSSAFTAWTDTLQTTGGGDLKPGVLSRPDQVFYEFTGNGVVTDVIAYQRRRKPFIGS